MVNYRLSSFQLLTEYRLSSFQLLANYPVLLTGYRLGYNKVAFALISLQCLLVLYLKYIDF